MFGCLKRFGRTTFAGQERVFELFKHSDAGRHQMNQHQTWWQKAKMKTFNLKFDCAWLIQMFFFQAVDSCDIEILWLQFRTFNSRRFVFCIYTDRRPHNHIRNFLTLSNEFFFVFVFVLTYPQMTGSTFSICPHCGFLFGSNISKALCWSSKLDWIWFWTGYAHNDFFSFFCLGVIFSVFRFQLYFLFIF